MTTKTLDAESTAVAFWDYCEEKARVQIASIAGLNQDRVFWFQWYELDQAQRDALLPVVIEFIEIHDANCRAVYPPSFMAKKKVA
jgi:hypothetical protein